VNRDDGNPDRGPSDWFKLCNLDDLFLTANIGYVSLFVDTSGSMKLKTVKPSYNKFTSEVEARSKNVSLVWNPKEDCENFTATKVFAAMEMDTSKLIQWVHLFMEDLGVPYQDPSIPVTEDNSATRSITHGGEVTKNVCHVAVQTLALQQLVDMLA
jgi:hypothetical protein